MIDPQWIIDLFMNFRFQAAATVIEGVMVKFILPNLNSELAKFVLTILRYADNIPPSMPTKKLLDEVIGKIERVFDMNSLPLKKAVVPSSQ